MTAIVNKNRELEKQPRALIRTLPLSNGNYGGILQAYALQRTIDDLGYLASVDLSDPLAGPSLFRSMQRHVYQRAIKLGMSNRWDTWLERQLVRREVSAPLSAFVREHIRGDRLYDRGGEIKGTTANRYSVFIVGSDQVWRQSYGNVDSYLFQGLDPSFSRFSYAASFGTDEPEAEIDPTALSHQTVLASRFNGMSVREESAVAATSRLWNFPSVQHVDPTLLISRDAYLAISEEGTRNREKTELMTYVLDQSQLAQEVVLWAETRVGASALNLVPREPSDMRELRARRDYFRRPSVQSWLAGFASTNFVVTDSFHGTVFSILNEVPFVSISNAGRGAARFESLLRVFGLEDRLVHSPADLLSVGSDSKIDWSHVREVLENERSRSLFYLKEQLTQATGKCLKR